VEAIGPATRGAPRAAQHGAQGSGATWHLSRRHTAAAGGHEEEWRGTRWRGATPAEDGWGRPGPAWANCSGASVHGDVWGRGREFRGRGGARRAGGSGPSRWERHAGVEARPVRQQQPARRHGQVLSACRVSKQAGWREQYRVKQTGLFSRVVSFNF